MALMHAGTIEPHAEPNARRGAALGFSLIEVLISMSLLAVGMTAIATTYGMLADSAEHERRVTHALHVGEATIEELLVRYAADNDLTQGTHSGGPSYTAEGVPGGSFFTTSWEVSTGVPIANARQIRVTVTWHERTGTKTLSLVTVRT